MQIVQHGDKITAAQKSNSSCNTRRHVILSPSAGTTEKRPRGEFRLSIFPSSSSLPDGPRRQHLTQLVGRSPSGLPLTTDLAPFAAFLLPLLLLPLPWTRRAATGSQREQQVARGPAPGGACKLQPRRTNCLGSHARACDNTSGPYHV